MSITRTPIPTTEEQILLADFRVQLQQEQRRLSAEQLGRYGPPYIAVWSPQLTTKMEDDRRDYINTRLTTWAEKWWQDRSYETVLGADGSVGIKSKMP